MTGLGEDPEDCFDLLDYLGATLCEVCQADLWQGDVWCLPVLDGPPGTAWDPYVAVKVCGDCLEKRAEALERDGEESPDAPEDSEWWTDYKRKELES